VAGLTPFVAMDPWAAGDGAGARLAAERGDAAVLVGLLDRYRIAWTLAQAQATIAQTLDHLAGWRRAYPDGQAVIHVRAN
jgi:hypothetical protein